MPDWIAENQQVFWILGVASVVVFVASLLLMPALIVRIPMDYFAHETRPPSRWAKRNPAVRLAILIAKNVLGVALVLGGIAMLVLPGQGLLTIFAGVVLLDFPRKYAFERWLIRRRWVHRPVNWLRRRRHREPLLIEPSRIPNI
ncbi:MAG: PGPGW domain-containing protein [Phycisphaera sp.]|nr:MAG: PGPGW domain-containing protein [Phycisphaera sp.]